MAEARANVGTYRDTLRQIEFAREQALRSLELLLGRYPAAEIAVAPSARRRCRRRCRWACRRNCWSAVPT